MKLSELYAVIDGYAPKKLSDDYCALLGFHDNSGILLDSGDEVKGVLFALDFSKKTIEKAKEIGANVIVTHHPAIFNKIGEITMENVLGEKLQSAIRAGISVISMHLNMDVAHLGVDEYLMKGLGGKDPVMMDRIGENGYGRVYEVKYPSVEELKKHIVREFKTDKVWAFGETEVSRIASFCGAGVSDDSIAFALRHGASVVVSSDIKHNYLTDMLDCGLAIVQLTHYASENYGFQRIYYSIKGLLSGKVACSYFTDETLL